MADFLTQLRVSLIIRWQRKWDQEAIKGQWTKLLIRKIKPWVERSHGDVTYELCQFLTGHGNYASYLKRMNLQQEDSCKYCGETDTPEHMVFHCPRWTNMCLACCGEIGETITLDNITDLMLKNKESWNISSKYIKDITQRKASDERQLRASTAKNTLGQSQDSTN